MEGSENIQNMAQDQPKVTAQGTRRFIAGVILALIGAAMWGFSGTSSQYLMETFHMDPFWISSVRLIVTGSLLFIFLLIKDAKALFAVWKDPGSVIRLVCFAIIGLMGNQVCYLKAIEVTNAGVATVIQYTSPVMILLWVCLTKRRRPRVRETVGVILTMVGVFLIATQGDLTKLNISSAGLAWGIVAAVLLAAYNLIPAKLMAVHPTLIVSCWGMLIGGGFETLALGTWKQHYELPPIGYGALAITVVFGTLVAYTFYLQGVRWIGPVRASMISTIEPLAATGLSALLLGTQFSIQDIAGCILVLITVILLAKPDRQVVDADVDVAEGEGTALEDQVDTGLVLADHVKAVPWSERR